MFPVISWLIFCNPSCPLNVQKQKCPQVHHIFSMLLSCIKVTSLAKLYVCMCLCSTGSPHIKLTLILILKTFSQFCFQMTFQTLTQTETVGIFTMFERTKSTFAGGVATSTICKNLQGFQHATFHICTVDITSRSHW